MPAPSATLSLKDALALQTNTPVTQLFQRLECVGKGAYGSVHKGVHIATGRVIALKIIDLDQPDDEVEDIQREVALLSQLRGDERTNVTAYYGCWLDGPRVWIAMDFAQGGSIRTLMKASKGGIIEERYAVLITREILIALSFLHHSNIIHRDLKAANVLLTAAGKILLCDFGVSALLLSSHSKRATFAGTPYWMAPEVITSGQLYDTKADIWSLGITIYEIVTGAPPHANQEQMRALVLIPKTRAPRLPETLGTKDMRDFVALVLRELPADRPSADELQRSKWIKGSQKTPLVILKELIVRYEEWLQSGGVRASIADGLPWEQGENDDIDLNPWRFDESRASYIEAEQSNESDNSINATERPHKQAPHSLRMLFEDTNQSPDQSFRHAARLPTPNHEHESSSMSNDVNFIEDYDSEPVSVIMIPESLDIQTARPNNFGFASRATDSLDMSNFMHGSSSSSRGSYKEIRNARGIANISVPRRPSQSGSISEFERDSSPRIKRTGGDLDRSSSPHRPVHAGRRNVASPANFTFPAAPYVPPPSASLDTPSIPQTQAPALLSPAVPETPNEQNGRLPLLRAQTASPYTNTADTVKPQRTPLARQYSAGVLDASQTQNTSNRTRPVRSGSTGTPLNESFASSLAVPKVNGLRDVLNLSPITGDASLGIDMLPPSPSALSPNHRQPFSAAPGAGFSISPEINGSVIENVGKVTDSNEPHRQTPGHSRNQSKTTSSGPTIRPLDYSMLATSDAVHAELSQTVADLSQWLSVIEQELSTVLDQPPSGITLQEGTPSSSPVALVDAST